MVINGFSGYTLLYMRVGGGQPTAICGCPHIICAKQLESRASLLLLLFFLLTLRLLLVLLFLVLRGNLPLLQRLIHLLRGFVSLALMVHRHLRLALIGRGNDFALHRIIL